VEERNQKKQQVPEILPANLSPQAVPLNYSHRMKNFSSLRILGSDTPLLAA
jgi:hypothetical protein